MQSQTTFTRAKAIGPILTLILLSSPGRDRAGSEILCTVSAEGSTPDYTPLAAQEEAFRGAELARRPLRLGPILMLILTAGSSQPEAPAELAVRRI
jgi:hypothetical protein